MPFRRVLPRTERRYRAFYASRDLLTAIFAGRVVIDGPALPPDAKVVNVSWDDAHCGLCVTIQSESFDDVPDHEVIPVVGPLRLRAIPPTIVDFARSPAAVTLAAPTGPPEARAWDDPPPQL